MRSSTRRVLVTAVVALASALAASPAAAETVTVDPGGSITATSLGNVTYSAGGIASTECSVALVGTLAGTFDLTAGSHVGSVTAATVRSCTVATGVALALPWELSYVSADTGGDPFELRLVARAASFGLTAIPILGTCLYGGDVPLTVEAPEPTDMDNLQTGLAALAAAAVPLSSGGFLCPSTGAISGTLALAPTQGLAAAPQLGVNGPIELDARTTSKIVTVVNQGKFPETISRVDFVDPANGFRLEAPVDHGCPDRKLAGPDGDGDRPRECDMRLTFSGTRPATSRIGVWVSRASYTDPVVIATVRAL